MRLIPTPKKSPLKNVQMVCAGVDHSVAVAGNVLYTWGRYVLVFVTFSNEHGQCAGPMRDSVMEAPQEVSVPFKIASIVCGFWHTVVRTVNDKLYVFGRNVSDGMLMLLAHCF